MIEKLKAMKTITAGQLFKVKGCQIGKDIFAIHKENTEAEMKQRQERIGMSIYHLLKMQKTNCKSN